MELSTSILSYKIKRSPRVIFGAFVGVSLFLLIFAVILDMKGFRLGKPHTSIPTPQIGHRSMNWLSQHLHYNSFLERHSPKIIFFGDSITEKWNENGNASWNQHFESKGAVNFGITGDRIQNLLWRIQNGNLDSCCTRLIVINIGTYNIIDGNDPYDIVDGIMEIVETIRRKAPKSKILVLPILPFGSAESSLREKIERVNFLLKKKLSNSDSLIKELRIGKILLGNSSIEQENVKTYLNSVQLTIEGYKEWAEKIAADVNFILTMIHQDPKPLDYKLSDIIKSSNEENFIQTEEDIEMELNEDMSLPPAIEKAYCINLDSRQDRWNSSKRKFVEFGIPVKRWSATETKDINWDNISLGRRSMNYFYYRQTHIDLPSLGSIACYLSHVSIWQHMIDANISSALIFEDDIIFEGDFKKKLESFSTIFDNSPTNSECSVVDGLWLGANKRNQNRPTSVFNGLERIDGPFFGGYAYILTQKAARILLQNIFPIEAQIDAYIGMQAHLNQELGLFFLTHNIVKVYKSELQTSVQNDLDPEIDK